MSDTPIDPIADPAGAGEVLPGSSPAVSSPLLPAALRVLVDLAMPDDHPDAPGVWAAGTQIASIHLNPEHIPLLLERGIVDAAPAAAPDAPPEP